MPILNIEFNQRVVLQKPCSQASSSILGACYGYSAEWARCGDLIFLGLDPQNNYAIPFTDDVKTSHFSQFFNPYERQASLYFMESGLKSLIDKLDTTLEIDDVALLNCTNVIGGHCLALKKTHAGFEFFDCNRGKYSVPSIAIFKEWFPAYLKSHYCNLFYIFNTDIVRATQPRQHILLTRAKNLLISSLHIAIRICTFPIGIYKFGEALCRFISIRSAQRNVASAPRPPQDNSTYKSLNPTLRLASSRPSSVKPANERTPLIEDKARASTAELAYRPISPSFRN